MCHITQMPPGIPGESTPSTQPELTFPYHLSTFHLGREKNSLAAFMEQEFRLAMYAHWRNEMGLFGPFNNCDIEL